MSIKFTHLEACIYISRCAVSIFLFFKKYISVFEFRSSIKSFNYIANLYQLEHIIRSKTDKFLTITQSFSSGSESDFVDKQTFQNYMHKLAISDFVKITCEEYLRTSKEQKLAVIKDYVHAMKNFHSSLNGEFLFINSLSYLFCFFCLRVSSHSIVTFETFDYGQDFYIKLCHLN